MTSVHTRGDGTGPESSREAVRGRDGLAEDSLLERVDRLEVQVRELRARFAARPFMAWDAFGLEDPSRSGMGYELDQGRLAGQEVNFAELFRGRRKFIQERQRPYLGLFAAQAEVVGIGCGRGEFLELLQEAGVSAIGVELDPRCLAHCRKRGLNVVEADALEYLEHLPTASLDGIFCAQVIEHLGWASVEKLLDLARERLREGGTLVIETVNPESFEALKTFHVDPTHVAPVFPQVLLFMCAQTGFRRAEVFYPTAGGVVEDAFDSAGEYAVIAHV